MKKLILFLTFISLFLGCSSDSDSNSNNNNPSNGNVNYYFKIKINGVEHKVQGNTSGFNSSPTISQNPNYCQATIGTTTILTFAIQDITKPNYVSGQTLFLSVYIPNCQLGLNQATMSIVTSPVRDNFLSNLGSNISGFVENSGLYCGFPSSLCQYPAASFGKITINVTDLGTPTSAGTNPSINFYDYGNTFKGSFTGPIYYGTSSTNSDGQPFYNMNIPMQFSMEFEAYRTN